MATDAAAVPDADAPATSAVVVAQRAKDDEDNECVICLESLESRGGAVPLPCECKVAYCAYCWDRALAASLSACGRALCPSCRCAMLVNFDSKSGHLRFSRAPVTGHSSSPRSDGSESSDDEYGRERHNEDDWRKRLYQQAKPLQIRLLQRHGEAVRVVAEAATTSSSSAQCAQADATPEQPRCVCGSRLRCTSVRDRVLAFVYEEGHVIPAPSHMENLMLQPPIVCDICSRQVVPTSNVWTCENGRKTVLHAVRYDVCEACFAYYTHGRGSLGHKGPGAGALGEDDDDYESRDDDTSEGDTEDDAD